jgi:hypothetical protein
MTILNMIRNQDYDVLSRRPSLGIGRKLTVVARALLHRPS